MAGASAYTRNPLTGVYTLKADKRMTVATYCECTYSRCASRWGVYADYGMGSELQEQHFTREEAMAACEGYAGHAAPHGCWETL